MRIVRFIRSLWSSAPPVEVRIEKLKSRQTARQTARKTPAIADIPGTSRNWQRAIESSAPTASRGRWRVAMVERYCESPIEKIFAAAFFSVPCSAHRDIIAPCYLDDVSTRVMAARQRMTERCLGTPPKLWVLIPQVHFDHNRRIDFVLVLITSDDEFGMIAIECDGKEFHNAREDAKRDRLLLAEHGLRTLRFSGSEIVKDRGRCARLAMDAVRAWS